MKNISIIFPTRNRSQLCISSIKSLLDTCEDKHNFEILIAVDDDDKAHSEIIKSEYSAYENIHIYEYPRYGYKGFHFYINNLVKIAEGNSLFLWNDDCVMKSPCWDSEIIKNHKSFCVLNPFVDTMASYCRSDNQILFPIIPKTWTDITGRWANNAACDTWIQDIARSLNISRYLDSVVLSHNRYDVTGKNNDIIFAESRLDISSHIKNDFYSEYQFHERRKDLVKLHTWMTT